MRMALCLFKYFPYGGLQRDFLGIAKECVARGHHVDVYTLEWQGDIPPEFNVTVISVQAIFRHNRYRQFAKKIKKAIDHTHYDVVMGFNKIPYLDIYFAADPCYEALLKRERSVFYRYIPRYRAFSTLEKCIFENRSTTQILTISQKQQDEFIECYGTDSARFYLLPPWILPDRFPPADTQSIRAVVRKEYHIADDEYFLLMVGSGFKIKGLDRTLTAINHLPASLKNKTRLLVIGQDNPNAFIKMVENLGLSAQVKFLGGRNDVPRFLFAADLLVHPAIAESAGIILLDAVVAGLPVLVTDTCGYASHVRDSGAGVVLSSPFVQKKFNQTLKEMMCSPKRAEWRLKGIAYGEGNHFDAMPQQAVDQLEEVARKKDSITRVAPSLRLRDILHTKFLGDDVFSEIMALQGQIYRDVDNRKTLRFMHEDRAYFAKLHTGVGWGEIFKNLLQFRFPVLGAKNEWLAIKRLEMLGVDTMHLMGYGERGCNPARKQSFVITKALPESQTLEDVCRHWPTTPPPYRLKVKLIEKVAAIAKKLHENGVNHRDLYICHFLLKQDESLEPDQLTLFLIDLHRVQLRNKTPQRWIVKDVGSLYFSAMDIGLTRRDIIRFMKHYSGCSLRDTLQEDKLFWQQVQARGAALYRKGYKSLPSLVVET